ncbi:polysaccharide deacetylase family protein [Paenibacillus ehimensis]|uniref:Polysaccharide deacetylase family protein n=1 Tax=Paenibacillus ehimensis TaxID=79264 RepID=A0ABT8VG67_9BACL|nr:polysaccharide deacetylase family protein [Paenibacillus ehimensis]MDO3679958.1 polysaccharide deacetylase family protein [Paenibacillus ehimensis]
MAIRILSDRKLVVLGASLLSATTILMFGIHAAETRPPLSSVQHDNASVSGVVPEQATHAKYTGNPNSSQEAGTPTAPAVQPSDGRTAGNHPEAAVQQGKPGPVKATKQVALTFDDGPDTKYTPQVLDILKQYEAKATFFVVGRQVVKHPDVLKRIHEEGHSIGNHSWDHANLTKLSSNQIQKEITSTDEAIEKIIGASTPLVRAPYGAVTASIKRNLTSAGHQLVEWTVDTKDWSGTASADMVELVRKRTKDGGIILMHSFGGKNGNLDNTVEALPLMIEALKQDGYAFVTVPELGVKKE